MSGHARRQGLRRGSAKVRQRDLVEPDVTGFLKARELPAIERLDPGDEVFDAERPGERLAVRRLACPSGT